MNKKFLHWKFYVAATLVVTVFLATVPIKAPQAEAGLPSCLVEGFLKGVLSSFSDKVLGEALDIIDNAINTAVKKVFKFLSGGEVPEKEKTLRAKETFKDVAARCLARMVFDSSIGGMLDVVRRQGRDGGASYVRNWRNFQTNAQYRGEAVFRGMLANTKTCDYLQQNINKAFRVTAKDKTSFLGSDGLYHPIGSFLGSDGKYHIQGSFLGSDGRYHPPGSFLGVNGIYVEPEGNVTSKGQNTRIGDADPFAVTGRCTMPSGFDMEKYKQDFSGNGGWGTFLRMLEPQNNYFGLVLRSINEADKQKAMEISSDLQEAQAGRGYLGLRSNAPCLQRAANGTCTIYNNITSPGSYVADTVAATIQQELAWITNVDELEELIIDGIANRLTKRLLSLGSDEEAPSYTNEPPLPDICPDFGPDAKDPLCRPSTPEPSATPPESTPLVGCLDKPPIEQFHYLYDIRRAQNRVGDRALRGEDVGLDLNDTAVITDFDKYHAAVIEELHGAGFPLAFYDGEEVEICKAGDGFSEHSDISTSTSRVRPAFNNSICSPAEIPECN